MASINLKQVNPELNSSSTIAGMSEAMNNLKNSLSGISSTLHGIDKKRDEAALEAFTSQLSKLDQDQLNQLPLDQIARGSRLTESMMRQLVEERGNEIYQNQVEDFNRAKFGDQVENYEHTKTYQPLIDGFTAENSQLSPEQIKQNALETIKNNPGMPESFQRSLMEQAQDLTDKFNSRKLRNMEMTNAVNTFNDRQENRQWQAASDQIYDGITKAMVGNPNLTEQDLITMVESHPSAQGVPRRVLDGVYAEVKNRYAASKEKTFDEIEKETAQRNIYNMKLQEAENFYDNNYSDYVTAMGITDAGAFNDFHKEAVDYIKLFNPDLDNKKTPFGSDDLGGMEIPQQISDWTREGISLPKVGKISGDDIDKDVAMAAIRLNHQTGNLISTNGIPNVKQFKQDVFHLAKHRQHAKQVAREYNNQLMVVQESIRNNTATDEMFKKLESYKKDMEKADKEYTDYLAKRQADNMAKNAKESPESRETPKADVSVLNQGPSVNFK